MRELLFDVIATDAGAVGPDEYTPVLWWVDPDGTPPEDESERCTLASPGGPNTEHVNVDVNEPLTFGSYPVYTVRTPVIVTRVGCENATSSWLGGCIGEPDGFPVM